MNENDADLAAWAHHQDMLHWERWETETAPCPACGRTVLAWNLPCSHSLEPAACRVEAAAAEGTQAANNSRPGHPVPTGASDPDTDDLW